MDTQSKFLIVEDNAGSVETFIDLLEASEYLVTPTARATDAIRLVGRIKPDVVLLDLNLAS